MALLWLAYFTCTKYSKYPSFRKINVLKITGQIFIMSNQTFSVQLLKLVQWNFTAGCLANLVCLCIPRRWYSDVRSPAAFWIRVCSCRCHFLHCPDLDWALDGCTDHTNVALVNGGGWIPQSWLLCGLSCISKWILWWVNVL